jgi:IS4 transposase
MYSNKVFKDNGVLLDQIGKLKGFYVSKKYPEKLRYIKYFDEETDNEFEFLSNNFELTAEDIAQLYKYRWKVELFFYGKQNIMQSGFIIWTHNQCITYFTLQFHFA